MLEAVVGVALRAILASVVLGGALATLVFIATRTLALTAATRHALWTTALIATAVMPLAGTGVSVFRGAVFVSKGAPPPAARPPSGAWGPRSELAKGTPVGHDRSALAPSPSHSQQTKNAAASPVTTTAVTGPSFFAVVSERLAATPWTPRMSREIALAVVGIWALGALIGLGGLAASIARVRGLKRRSSPLDGALADELPWLTAVGRGREIYLRLSYETETPVAIGFRRPVILIPTELATADGLAAIEQLILHEYAHLRRNDDWTNLVQRTIERIFWFNPVVWMLGRKIALEREIASDDAVVEKTGEAHAYAASLWKLAREMRMPEHAVVAPGALLTRKQISVRIEELLDAKRARLHRSPITALGITLAGIAAVAFVATSAPAVELPVAPLAVTKPDPLPVKVRIAFAPPKVKAEPSAPSVAAKPARDTRAFGGPQPQERYVVTNPLVTPTPVVRERIVKVYEHVPTSATSSHAAESTARSSATAAREGNGNAQATMGLPLSAPLPLMPSGTTVAPPAVPPVAPAPGTTATLSHAEVKKFVTAVRAAAAPEVSNVGRDIGRAIHDAMAAVPRGVAQEKTSNTRRVRTDGIRLSRELIASCIGCSFRNADARGLDLHGLTINGSNFAGADFRGANLSGATLTGVSLAGANLTSTDLRGTQFNGVELRGAIFDGAKLEGVHLTGVSIKHVSLRGTSLRSVLSSCTGCDFQGFDLHGQDLHGIVLNGADLSDADLHDANLSGVRFNGVDLSNANLSGADLTNAHLDGCDLSGVDLRGARTTGLVMHGSSLGG